MAIISYIVKRIYQINQSITIQKPHYTYSVVNDGTNDRNSDLLTATRQEHTQRPFRIVDSLKSREGTFLKADILIELM